VLIILYNKVIRDLGGGVDLTQIKRKKKKKAEKETN
jgi:hypothetical protein